VYKVLLSGCVTDLKMLHSCVQAVFERLIIGNDSQNSFSIGVTTAAPVATIGLTVHVDNVSSDDQVLMMIDLARRSSTNLSL